MNGKLITIEGIDGSGKTTITSALVKETKKFSNREIVKTKEPTDTWLGKTIQKGLEREVDPLAEAFLFTADHIEHLEEVIKPALDRDKVVISDRYSDSFYAYQGTTLEEKEEINEPIDYLLDLRNDFTIKPDLTIFLDIDPETAVERVGDSEVKFENIAFQKKVRDKFKELIDRERDRFYVIDGSRTKKEIIKEIKDYLMNEELLG